MGRELVKYENLDMFGRRVRIGGRQFVVGKPALHRLGSGFVLVTGEILVKCGKRFWCVLDICEVDSCEVYGIYVPYKGKMVSDRDETFVASLGLRKSGMFPYRYRYDIPLRVPDHHIGEDGWSY